MNIDSWCKMCLSCQKLCTSSYSEVHWIVFDLALHCHQVAKNTNCHVTMWIHDSQKCQLISSVKKHNGFVCTREKLKWWRMGNCSEWSRRTAGMQRLGFGIWTSTVNTVKQCLNSVQSIFYLSVHPYNKCNIYNVM